MAILDMRDPGLYADWSYDDLREHVEMLSKLRDERSGHKPVVTKKRLTEMLDPTSDDFMGSGMRLDEWMMAMDIEKLNQSFHRQKRPERKRRMQYVIGLSKILAEIEAISIFATALARGAIADVIEGDWSSTRTMANFQEFWGEDFGHLSPEAQELWRSFSALLQEAFDTRPGAPEPPKAKN